MSAKPIFIFSLPRAGSTLLQRLLSQHGEISTAPEPWIAIPLFYALKADGVKSVYGHKALANAITGFIDSFPNKREDYLTAVADFLRRMYSLGSEKDVSYFVDKTPRYHLIVDDLMDAFPDAKFIFLWRNPLAISASMIQTWGKGKWNLYMFMVDLYQGIDSLVSAFNKNRQKSIAVKYEDLAMNPDEELTRIMTYLDLKDDGTIVKSFSHAKTMDVPGRGDPTGQHKYRGVSKNSMDSWKTVMDNPFRKAWSINYLHWLGHERLKSIGFDLKELASEITSQPVNYHHFISDIFRNIYGKIYCKYSIEDIRSNRPWRKNIYFPKN